MKSSGKKAASALIHTGPCRLRGVVLMADTVKNPSIQIEDNTTNANTNIWVIGRSAGGNEASGVEGGAFTFSLMFSKEDNVICDNGIYATLSAAEGDYIVYYDII